VTTRNLKQQEPVLVLRSRISGRERWEIPMLINQPRHALAVQTILASEPGILRIEANELTGRVLIHFDPEQIQDPIHNLLRRAFAFGPISEMEQQLLSAKPEAPFSGARLFLGAELGCLLFKVLFLCTLCPTAGITSALTFVLFARLKARSGSRRVSPTFGSTGGIIPDEPSGIEDHEDRTEIV
jgi:Heavy metal associated domain 2